ncbi:MAG TPA: hypothetical protein PLI27_00485 [Ignavibacteriales bacterium]|nr:hypothetical protein [Ignavibacteriales bacterium]HOL81146.1 hypothetical protein [Ignavibacteriales bacterium]HOM65249.1 hypothetical protein [Ignavibacteriales bacterium]HPD66541.1 hypothetical protein [Ignavibacteriales bacterium]HPP33498.1 hypothetical protein [Ignavibacteriales bacterium]
MKNTEYPDINIIPSYGYYLTPTWLNINPNYPTNDEGFAIIDFNDQEFEFYGKKFKKAYLSANGFLTFDTITSIANRQNTTIPNSNSPNNLIAFFWDNLKLINKSITKIYYIDKYILIEGKDWALSIDTSDNQLLSFKLLLNFYQNSITCAYDKVPQNTSSITIGIENSDGSDGIHVVYNNSSFKLNDAEIYKWIKYPKFINFSNSKFAIQNGNKQNIILTPNNEFIYPGYFNGKLLIHSNDIPKPVDTIIVNYTVNFPTSIEQNNLKNYILYQNYPNPFNPFTTISYSLPKKDYVKLKIFDIKGSLVKTLFEGIQEKGYYSFTWYGNNNYEKPINIYDVTGRKVTTIDKGIYSLWYPSI